MTDTAAAQTGTFFSAIWSPPDIVEVRAIWPERNAGKAPRSLWRAAGEWAGGADADWLDDMNREGWNLYAGVLPRMARGARGNASALPGAVLWADIDHATREEAASRLEASGLPAPSILVNTGHGVQCYWLLTEKRRPAELRALVGDIAALLGSDPSVRNEERVLRIPGFVNHKPPAADAELLECDPERCFEYEEIRAAVPAAAAKPAVAASTSAFPVSTIGRDDGTMERARRYLATVPGSGPGGRTNTAFRVAAVLVRDYALDRATALDLLSRWDGAANSPPIQADPQYGPDELSRIIRNAGRYGKHGVGELLNAPRADDGFDMGAFIARTGGVADRDALPAEAAGDEESDDDEESVCSPDIPETAFRTPGAFRAILSYIGQSAVRPQPVFDLMAAIAFVGAVLGRRVETESGLRTNFYVMCLGPSGCGKENARRALKRLMAKTYDAALGGEDMASDTGLLRTLRDHPVQLYPIDEFGKFLIPLTSPRAGSWQIGILTALTKLFSSANVDFKSKVYARADDNFELKQPHACLYATSVRKPVYDSLTLENVADGFLSRILVYETDAPEPDRREPVMADVPGEIVETVERLMRLDKTTPLSQAMWLDAPTTRKVPASGDAKKIFDDLETRARDRINALAGNPAASLWIRAREHAEKLALVYACCESASDPLIGPAAAAWGSELAEWLVGRFARSIRDNIAENQFHAKVLRYVSVIRKAGRKGIKRSLLTRKLNYPDQMEMNRVLETLVAGGKVFRELEGTKGRPAEVFTTFTRTFDSMASGKSLDAAQ